MPTNYTTAFDDQFRLQTEVFFSDVEIDGKNIDWRWFKAQALAESALRPKEISPAGARGIMQMMPATFEECKTKLGLPKADPFDPLIGIKFGIYYAKRMWRIFGKETGMERMRFMFAAYNAGAGNIIKAQRLASPTHQWWAVSKELPRITGIGNARETTGYVKRIEAFHRELTTVTR